MKALKSLFGIITLAAGLTLQVQAQSSLTNGLVAYYPFNGNVNDASGNGNNGTNYGATFTQDRFGLTNGAIYFNGSAYVLTGFFPPLGSASRTFSGWFNVPPSSYTTFMFYGGTGTYAGDRFELGIYDNSQFLLDCSAGGVITANSYADSNWHSFVVVVPLNATLSNVLLYMDGIPQTDPTVLSSGDQINTATDYPLQFGELWVGQRLLTGALGDVRIYNRALSSNEVEELYAFESTPPTPQFTQNLTNSYAAYGQNATLGVSVSSQSPVSYQWYFLPANNGGQAGAYADTFYGFVYNVVVTNGGFGYGNIPNVEFVGGGGSAEGYATVSNGVVTGITVTNSSNGYTSAPSVVIDPPDGLMYGATNRILTISNANQNSLGNYYIVISNQFGSITSSVDSLTLLYPPSITSQPQDQVVNAYGTANYAVGVAGTSPFYYQWLFEGTNLPNANAGTLTITNVTPQNLGQYSVIVDNDYGSVTSSVANLFMYPFLITPFSGAITYWGQTNELGVETWGSGDLSYQWYFNGIAIAGATGSNYVLSGIQFTNAGLYSVVVSSSYGSVTNTPEQVVVNPADVSLALRADVVIQGTVGYNYTIQSTTNLGDTNSWNTETNITLTQPVQDWDDNSVDVHKGTQKYYRVLPGQ